MLGEPLDEDDDDPVGDAIHQSDRYKSSRKVSKGTKKKKSLLDKLLGGK